MMFQRRAGAAGVGGVVAAAAIVVVVLSVAPSFACSPGARVEVNPKVASPGTEVQVDGALFDPQGGPVELYLVGASATKLMTVYLSPSRSFTRLVPIPGWVVPGSYEIKARQLNATRTAELGSQSDKLQVIDEATAPAGPAPPAPSGGTTATTVAAPAAPGATAAPVPDPARGDPVATAPAEPGATASPATSPVVPAREQRIDGATPARVPAASGPVTQPAASVPGQPAAAASAAEPAPAVIPWATGAADGVPPVGAATGPLVVSDPSVLGGPRTVGGGPSPALLMLGVLGLAVFVTGTTIVVHDRRKVRAGRQG